MGDEVGGAPPLASMPAEPHAAANPSGAEICQMLQDLCAGQLRIEQELQRICVNFSQGQGLLMEEITSIRQFLRTAFVSPNLGYDVEKRMSSIGQIAEQFVTSINEMASAGSAVFSSSPDEQDKNQKGPRERKRSSANRDALHKPVSGCLPVPFGGNSSERKIQPTRRARSTGRYFQETGSARPNLHQQQGPSVTAHNVSGTMNSRLQEAGPREDKCGRISIHPSSPQSILSRSRASSSNLLHQGNVRSAADRALVVTFADASSEDVESPLIGDAGTATVDCPSIYARTPASELRVDESSRFW